MPKFYIALDCALAVVNQRNGRWVVDIRLKDISPQCVAVDPFHLNQVYCGTFDNGLWSSSNGGTSWRPVGDGIEHRRVTSIAVSARERTKDSGVVYAGTEPSAIFRSVDQGNTWSELSTLRQLPSAPTWSYPPRPHTSHVRWITPDPLIAGRVFAAIEAGALVRSLDGGQTWEDRKPDGPFDTHTLIMHRLVADRLYSAAGDGFMDPGTGFLQSDDGGNTWYRSGKGLRYHYLWSIAADPGNPNSLIVSAAPGPREAHRTEFAESAIYYRTAGGVWEQAQIGLPEAKGMLISILASSPAEPGIFYAANNLGIFRSVNAGATWEELIIPFPEDLHLGVVNALVVMPE